MKAMILAAGFGTRLRPITDQVPKAMVPVGGGPMIVHALGLLRSFGLRQVIINLHHLGRVIERGLGDGSGFGVDVRYSREEEILGTGGGIVRARKFFGRERIVLINCDCLIDADFNSLLARHERSSAAATLAMVSPADREQYTEVMVDAGGFIRSIGGKPPFHNGGGGDAKALTYSGLAVIEPELIDLLPSQGFSCLVNDGIIPALSKDASIAAWLHEGYWKGLDSEDKIREAERDIASGAFRPLAGPLFKRSL